MKEKVMSETTCTLNVDWFLMSTFASGMGALAIYIVMYCSVDQLR